MSHHLDQDRLSALLDGALEGAERAGAERHLEGCAACRDALAALAAQDRALRPALEHDPGEAYFEEFAARVGGRLRASGLRGAQARERPSRLAEWFRSPRKLSVIGAVATLVAGAGIVMLATREVRFPLLRRGELPRSEQVATETAVAAPESQTSPESPVHGPSRTPAPEGALGAPDQPSAGAQAPLARPAEPRLRQSLATRGQGAPPGQVSGSGTSDAGQTVLSAPSASAVPNRGADAIARREGGGGAALPSRAREVRRDESGEEVAVGPSSPFPYQPRTKSFTPSPAGSSTRVVKENYATPMTATDQQEKAAAPAPSLAVTGAARGVCGTIVDDRGRPVAGARIADPASGVTVTSDGQGAFCFERAPGEISVLAIGFHPAQRAVTPGERLRIALEPVAVLRRPAAGRTTLAEPGPGQPDLWRDQPTWTATHGRNAQRLTALAERIGVAPAWESAAAEWELTLDGVSGATLAERVRYETARARVAAWRLAPTPKRAAAARTALAAFLEKAARGAQRDSAGAWSRALGR